MRTAIFIDLNRTRLAVLCLVAVSAGCGSRGCASGDTSVREPAPVLVELSANIDGDNVNIEYRFANRTSSPVLLLDRWKDWEAFGAGNVMDSGWFYAKIDEKWFGSKAILSRRLVYQGFLVENPDMPCGRKVDPGETVSGSFQLQLPLTDGWSSDGKYAHPKSPHRVTIREVEIQLGWSPQFPHENPQLRFPEDVNGEMTWILTPSHYQGMLEMQQLIASNVVPVRWSGLVEER